MASLRPQALRDYFANLAPFRGTEPDSGTVFEVGAAVALGLPLIGYRLPPGDYADRVPDAQRDTLPLSHASTRT